MSILTSAITAEQARRILSLRESQFIDFKSTRVSPASLTECISSFANADGGEVYVGIEDEPRLWKGFENEEAANGHMQIFDELFPSGENYQYEFLESNEFDGLVLHIQIQKARDVIYASNRQPYKRVGAQSIVQNTIEKVRRLELSKGVVSFEIELLNIDKGLLVNSTVMKRFIKEVVPTNEPEPWLRKQNLIQEEKPTVAGTLIFCDEPQAVLPKHCGIKIYRYKTNEPEGKRDLLANDPQTIEGDLYSQISEAVRITKEITEKIPKVSKSGEIEVIKYPTETLHEILTNAVLHRDYSIKDDVHIRIFDDRVEVLSPGRLPAHITPENILEERFSRNGAIVRILNKFPNPPNKDVGEGLNTAFIKMREIGLKDPLIKELDNAVLVIIRHEPLDSPVEIIMAYLDKNPQIKNSHAREITRTPTDFRMKNIFNKMEKAGLIEKVPGTNTSSTAYRKVRR